MGPDGGYIPPVDPSLTCAERKRQRLRTRSKEGRIGVVKLSCQSPSPAIKRLCTRSPADGRTESCRGSRIKFANSVLCHRWPGDPDGAAKITIQHRARSQRDVLSQFADQLATRRATLLSASCVSFLSAAF